MRNFPVLGGSQAAFQGGEHGHLEGDDVLKGVAQHLLGSLRASAAGSSC